MKIKFCLSLLIFWVGLAQGLSLASEDNKEASSALLHRQKRASKQVINISPDSSPPHELSGYLMAPRNNGPEVGSYYPGYWQGKVPIGMVRVFHRGTELGLGIVIKGHMIVTKAHFFSTPIGEGEYYVLSPEKDGSMVRHYVVSKIDHELYGRHRNEPWGPDDICFAATDGRMAKAYDKPDLIEKSRLFTADQLAWLSIRAHKYLVIGS